MPRKLSFRPALTMWGRKFKGLRGWAAKPLHPPLTDVPVGDYMLIGRSLAYDYGFNVETAGDSPVWHASEVDVLPADKG